MREIEFRRAHFFDKECTKFSHLTIWGVNVGIQGSIFTAPSTNNFALYHIEEQFVGLVGKNKIKTFEGDSILIKWSNGDESIADIIYSQEEYGFNYLTRGCKFPGNSLYELINYDIEVIGNIHDKK